MLRNTFRNMLEAIVEDITLDEIKRSIDKLKSSRRTTENIVEDFLKEIGFQRKFRQHPLIWKTINWGNATKEYRTYDVYRSIHYKLTEVLNKQKIEGNDLRELRDLLKELKSIVIKFIERQAGDIEQGLRHIHAPGSVAMNEGRNLYFGEKFTDDDLYRLALRLCSSIAFGENIGIYSEDKNFMENMKRLIESFSLGPSFKIERGGLRTLGIQENDLEYPYIVFLKFIIWLRNQIDIEEDPNNRKICLSTLERLRVATINIFFMPPDTGKWCTISIPRLDFFINNWIQRDEARKSLKELVEAINNFIEVALRESRRREYEKVENVIKLLMNNYEMLCRRLVEYGIPDFYALRNMMDIMIDLSVKYDIKSYFKPLTLAISN